MAVIYGFDRHFEIDNIPNKRTIKRKRWTIPGFFQAAPGIYHEKPAGIGRYGYGTLPHRPRLLHDQLFNDPCITKSDYAEINARGRTVQRNRFCSAFYSCKVRIEHFLPKYRIDVNEDVLLGIQVKPQGKGISDNLRQINS